MKYNYFEYWTKAFDFTGRTRRRDYWISCSISFVLSLLVYAYAIATQSPYLPVIDLVPALLLFPSIAMGVRRLHDVGKTGLLVLIGCTGIGSIILFWFYCQDSQPGPNKWGNNPKNVHSKPFSSSLINEKDKPVFTDDSIQFNRGNPSDFNSYY